MTTSPSEPTPHSPRNGKLKVWLIVDTVLTVLAIAPITMMGAMSVMASDAGVNTMIYAFIWTMLTFPLVVALAPVAAWIAFWFRKERLALVLSLTPALWVVAIIVIFSLGFGTPHQI